MHAALRFLGALALVLVASAPVSAQDATLKTRPPVVDGDHGLDQSSPPGAGGSTTTGVTGAADLERRTSLVASGLRCPVCQGVSVEDSPTELARQMRAVVREQLAAGRSPDEVRGYFVDKYGEWILLQPKASGFNLLVYVLPWLAVLAGMTVIVLAVRRWTRPLPAEASAQTRAPASTFES